MKPPFNKLKVAPLKTRYHKKTAREMLADLDTYLLENLLPQVTIAYDTCQGTLTPVVNESRFCGPNSLVRDSYRLEFRFQSGDRSEYVEAEIRYRPAQRRFTVSSIDGLCLWTVARQEAQEDACARIEDLCQRILKGEPCEAQCPVCSSEIRVTNTPELFAVACTRLCFDYDFHRDPATQEGLHGHFFVRPVDHPTSPPASESQ